MLRRLLLAALALVPAACALLPGAPEQAVRRAAREGVGIFQLEGRIAVRRDGESFSARIDWRHEPGGDEIVLSGILGQGLARLSSGVGGAVLQTADQQRIEAASLDALTERVFGAQLPVSGMAHWVVGRPAFGAGASLDTAGRPAMLSEQGWTIEYLDYENDAATAMPLLLRARRENIEVRIKIDAWSLPQ
jgi:outer membrane lipoprotein LolB